MNALRSGSLVTVLLALVLALVLAACEADPTAPAASDEPTAEELAAWDAAAQERVEGKADNASCSGTVIPDRRGFGKRIALTFDDGPDLVKTPQVLAILAAHGAPATFFVNGSKVRSAEHRALLQRVALAGHLVGNHTQNHANLSQVSTAKRRSEVSQTHDLLAAAGVAPQFFRFPFGAANCTATALVREYGYRVTGWHIDSADWCYAAARGGVGVCDPGTFRWVPDQYRRSITAYVLSQARATGGGVLLLHDVHAYTVSVLDDVLTALEADGFTFVRLDDAAVFPLLNGAPTTPAKPPAWIGTPCGDDSACVIAEAGAAGGRCEVFSLADDPAVYGFCTVACEGYCPDRNGAGGTFCTSLDGVKGTCAARAGDANRNCAAIPGTAPRAADRFIGRTSAAPRTVTVCLPQ
jgi:peptidoglycan/xylan/chitin deacetylase (PgdA/CDA1 family)